MNESRRAALEERPLNQLIAVFAGLALLASAEVGHGQPPGRGLHRGGMMMGSMVRHRYVRQHGIPARYAAFDDPFDGAAEATAAGRKLYEQHCASCHGATGQGDGDAGKALTPPPANVAVATKMPIATDAYLYWTIAEGGLPLGTAMPPFASVLDERQTWSLIAYLRSL